MKNPHAIALGKLAAGKPKRYSEAERQKRRVRMQEARSKIKKQFTERTT